MDQHYALNRDEVTDPISAEKFMFPYTDSDKHFILEESTKFRNVSFFNAAYRFEESSGTPESDSEEEAEAIREHEEMLR